MTAPTTTPHAHHWRIEEPNGPTSHGVCRHCGAERDFPNVDIMDRDPNWRRLKTRSVSLQEIQNGGRLIG